ncbi:MAG: metal-dependent hydrolase [Novosphingobium sp.]
MNAHTTIPLDVEPTPAVGKAVPTPADLTITVRDQRFGRETKPGRWWLNHDPVATAWHNALSATFPRGEAFFIEAVKAHRDGASPKLEAEIRAFVRQEINHTREHIVFNKAATEAGYDLSDIDRRLAENLELTKGRPEILNLAVTMALEHYTAMMAAEFLKNPKHFAGAEPETAAMWKWHSMEEIEHKGVAYDTWLHATRDWTRWKRWKLKSVMMLLVTGRFVKNRWQDTIELLRQDGITGPMVHARIAWYLFGNPGVMRRVFPAWCAYFLPGFHPWNHDDRALIGMAESEFPDAVFSPA